MIFREICDLVAPGIAFRVYDRGGEQIVYESRSRIVRECVHLLDKTVLTMSTCIDRRVNEPYISVLLDMEKERITNEENPYAVCTKVRES